MEPAFAAAAGRASRCWTVTVLCALLSGCAAVPRYPAGLAEEAAPAAAAEVSPREPASPENRAEPKPVRPVVLPVDGPITSGYGFRRHPQKRVARKHEGIDIAVPKGTPVKPIASGVVAFSGVRTGYGKVVILDHGDGVVSLYAHNSRNLVRVDQRVEPGQVIALSGASGRATGPHLHFELWKDGVNFIDALVRNELPPGLLPEEGFAAARAELLPEEGPGPREAAPYLVLTDAASPPPDDPPELP
jgi:murein DD-endopeptidase MepM/ murein hydrolase activator NlpD